MQKLFFFFLNIKAAKKLVLLNSRISRNMCKLHHKVCNGQNLPHESRNFKNYSYITFRQLFHKSETTLFKQFVPKYVFFCVLLYTPECLETCVFGVTNCVMQKRLSVQLLRGQMKFYLGHFQGCAIRFWS